MLPCVLVLVTGHCHAAELLRVDFERAPWEPWLQVVGNATVEGGVLKSAPLEGGQVVPVAAPGEGMWVAAIESQK
ncbi:MAG: hypothetical protein FJX75_14240 [Armatimonadetes bacterium]|nr:hypothetical protein [Armatimonadota bacterium]